MITRGATAAAIAFCALLALPAGASPTAETAAHSAVFQAPAPDPAPPPPVQPVDPAPARPAAPPVPDTPAPEPVPTPAAPEPAAPAEGEPRPEGPPPPRIRTADEPPLGYAGRSDTGDRGARANDHFVPMPDRWRLGLPDWRRYPRDVGSPYQLGNWWDPYAQNVFKGDYPFLGQNVFLDVAAISDTSVNVRRLPTFSPPSAAQPGRYDFFGPGDQLQIDETLFLSFEMFRGQTAFRPRDWSARFTPAFNLNHLRAQETGVVNIDPRKGTSRLTGAVGLQELFVEKKLADLSPNYDFASLRAGVQNFLSDFRGFLFFDNEPAVRFFGNLHSNRTQYNLAYLRPVEKQTFSQLNTFFDDRKQNIVVANVYRQDLFRRGYTGQFTVAYNDDHGGSFFAANGIQQRPGVIGLAQPHVVRAAYLGWNGDGHLGRLNLSHAFYQVLGSDSLNPIAGRPTSINAQMAAAELSWDRDWLRLKGSFFFASGDRNPRDGVAGGFDSIFDNPFFAGGPFSFWQSQGIPLSGSFVQLTSPNSLLPNLRSSKLHGQANFVNPGILILNTGADAELTPKLRAQFNVNWLNLQTTQTLELVLNQASIARFLGWDTSVGLRYRPFLNENAVVFFGASALFPGAGFTDIYSNDPLYSVFSRLVLSY